MPRPEPIPGQYDTETEELLTAVCIICHRHSTEFQRMKKYSFGIQKSEFDVYTGKEVENPDYTEVWLCSSDMNLIFKFKRELKDKGRELKPRELIQRAIIYRQLHPIKGR